MLILKPLSVDRSRSFVQKSNLLLSFRVQVCHPHTCIRVRLLGPCFKTGRKKPFSQHPRTIDTKLIATVKLNSPGLNNNRMTIMPSCKSPAFLSRDKGPYQALRDTAAKHRCKAVLPECPRYVDAKSQEAPLTSGSIPALSTVLSP